jgi:hypothetical protein
MRISWLIISDLTDEEKEEEEVEKRRKDARNSEERFGGGDRRTCRQRDALRLASMPANRRALDTCSVDKDVSDVHVGELRLTTERATSVLDLS